MKVKTSLRAPLEFLEDGSIKPLKPRNLARDLKEMVPGKYIMSIDLVDTRLQQIKKYYFSMESQLARHLGMTKDELHSVVKHHTSLGRRIDPDSGETVYHSIAEVYDADTMLARITEFQQWAAEQFSYTFEPYKAEDHDQLGTPGLETDSST